LPQLKAHTGAALNIGVTPVEIREAVYQCGPFIGFPKTLNAVGTINEVFKERNISHPLENQSTVSEENRLNPPSAVPVDLHRHLKKYFCVWHVSLTFLFLLWRDFWLLYFSER
jgi:4-carboxymuconolactone decarboxylase